MKTVALALLFATFGFIGPSEAQYYGGPGYVRHHRSDGHYVHSYRRGYPWRHIDRYPHHWRYGQWYYGR